MPNMKALLNLGSKVVEASAPAAKVSEALPIRPAALAVVQRPQLPLETKAAIKLWGNTMYGNYDGLPRGPGDLAALKKDLEKYLNLDYVKDEETLYELADWFGEGASINRKPRLTRDLYDQLMQPALAPITGELKLYKSGTGKLPEHNRWLSTSPEPGEYGSWGPTSEFVLPKGTRVIDTQGLADPNEIIIRAHSVPPNQRKYAEGGAVQAPKVPGALSIIAAQLPKWWKDPQTADLRTTVESMVPQDAVDVGLMLLGGPGGKAARKAGAALIAGGASADAEAGTISALKSLLQKTGAPEKAFEILESIGKQAPATLDAIRPEALAAAISDSATSRPSTALVKGSPKEFLRQAHPLDLEDPQTQERIEWLRDMLTTQTVKSRPEFNNYYFEKYGPTFAGFGDVPKLGVNPTGKVVSHEGRHRMHSLAKEFGNETPLAVDVQSNWKDLPAALEQSYWTPQWGDSYSFPAMPKFAQGGAVKNPDQMTHKKSKGRTAADGPLQGSALQALARGWAAGTAGLPGDLEGLLRAGINASFGAGGVNVDSNPALPTSEFYKEWLPGKQLGDEALNTAGSLFGGVGSTLPVKGAKGALSLVAQGPVGKSAQRGIIKAPGGNWISAGPGAPARELQFLQHPVLIPENVPLSTRALNSFVDKQLTRYVKNDMATERDPIRALAERGISHLSPETLHMQADWIPERLEAARVAAGFPAEGAGKTTMAKGWEVTADTAVDSAKASEYTKPLTASERRQGLISVVDANPWLEKLDPEATVHAMPGQVQSLGFDHLIDELRNATNPNSGLPRELLLDPKSLDRLSVPQAVERVAKINAWREAQKVEANAAKANNAATVLHKEYLENNPKGLRWVELKQPEGPVPLSPKFEILETFPGTFKYQLKTPDASGGRRISPPYDSREEVEAVLAKSSAKELLADTLKYEGDTMGHCVGGYCDDVASGASRIFSLRDAKGQPHVTIEAIPEPKFEDPHGFYNHMLSAEAKPAFIAQLKELTTAAGVGPRDTGFYDIQKMLVEQHPEWLAHQAEEAPLRIAQIKGKANKKPNDEYLPFVQDFVKSGKWSYVSDLENAGLIDARSLKDSYKTTPEFYEAMSAKYGTDFWPDSDAEWKAFTGNGYKVPPEGFAAGGPVFTPEQMASVRAFAATKPSEDAITEAMNKFGVSPQDWKASTGTDAPVLPWDQVGMSQDRWNQAGLNNAPQLSADLSNAELVRVYQANKGDPAAVNKAIAARLKPPTARGSGDDFTPYDSMTEAEKVRRGLEQRFHTAGNFMTRDDFLKKYGTTFVADDKGGNAASEVAGGDVGKYYDMYLAPGAKGDKRTQRGGGSDIEFGEFYSMPDWSAGKYTDAHPYFDSWDNVRPHPESQKGNGWDEAWKQVRPFAAMAAMAYGANALGGALGGGSAATAGGTGIGGTAGIGSGTALGGAATTGVGGTLTAAGTFANTAPGLAGMLGMGKGMTATAVNTGALNTGIGLARGQKPIDALKTGLTSAALSPVGSFVGDAVGGGYVGKLAGSTAVGGLQGVASGRGLIDGAQQGLVAGGIDIAGDYVGGLARSATGNKFAGTAANSLTQSTLKGLPPGATLDSLATQYAAGEIKDLTGLDPKMAKIVLDLARNKKVSAVGARTALGSAADRAVGSRKLSRAAAGG